MAINVDKVYKQVLAIMDKEGRGYLPAPEFNLLAHRAQMDIFDNTFHDYKMALLKPKNQSKFADELDMIREKIAEFRAYRRTLTKVDDGSTGNISTEAHWVENVYQEQISPKRTVSFNVGDAAGIMANPNAETDVTQIRLRGTYVSDENKNTNTYILFLYHSGFHGFDSQFTSNTGDVVTINSNASEAALAQKIVDTINDSSPFHTATKDSTTHKITVTYKTVDGIDFTTTEDTHNFHFSVGNPDVSVSQTSAVDESIYYEEIDRQDWLYITSGGAKLKPTTNRPVFYRLNKTTVGLYPPITSNIKHDYIYRPLSPEWNGYENKGNWVYDSAASQNFTLHNSEEGTLVNKILELAGVKINKLELTQAALQNEQINEADKNN